jgi:superfamily I DNA/RNA helicase
VLDGLFERLAPDVHLQVDFKAVHSLAGTILHERGVDARIDDVAARARFDDRLTADPDRGEALARAGFGAKYLWDEITRVIEGREVQDLDGYLALARHGRHQPMQEPERRAVWQLYSEYRDACDRADPPIASWSQHLTLARAALVDRPWAERYRAIVVDEAQDVTQAGVRLLTELVSGGTAGQLMLIGDNAQRIYPGGFRLRDLGLEVRGRSFILDMCYRSTHEIMEAANALGRYLSSDDFGEDGVRGVGWRTSRYGPRPRLHEFRSVHDEQSWLTNEIVSLATDERDAVGLLVPTNKLADSWRRELKAAGVVTCELINYKGKPLPGVKVGTYNRAKGLEFARVILPNLSRFGLSVDADKLDDVILRGSQLYVAMTRARDRVDLSYAGEPSLYVEPLLNHVDIAATVVRQ